VQGANQAAWWLAQLVPGSTGLAWSTTERPRLRRLGSRAHSRPASVAPTLAAWRPMTTLHIDRHRAPVSCPSLLSRRALRSAQHSSEAERTSAAGRARGLLSQGCACVLPVCTHWSIGPLARAVRAGGRVRGWAVSAGCAHASHGTGRSTRARRRSRQRSRRTGPLLSHTKRAALGSRFAAQRWPIGRTARLGPRVNGTSPGEVMQSLAGGEGRR